MEVAVEVAVKVAVKVAMEVAMDVVRDIGAGFIDEPKRPPQRTLRTTPCSAPAGRRRSERRCAVAGERADGREAWYRRPTRGLRDSRRRVPVASDDADHIRIRAASGTPGSR
jgi:hypothetical protein